MVVRAFLFYMNNILQEIGDIIADFFSKEEAWLIIIVLFGAGVVATFAAPDLGEEFSRIINSIWLFFKGTWWLWAFLILFAITKEMILHWRQEDFKSKINFFLLEIKIPREIDKSPRAMEQVLAAIHTLRNAPGDIGEKYVDGEVTSWFTLEMASFGGEVHFYVRGKKKQRNLVEAAFFSYYPDVELEEVDDYLEVTLPQSVKEIYGQRKDFWSTEMLLAKEEAYPIKTYEDFEHEADEKDFDPISIFMEILGKVKKNEFVGIQFNIAPAGNEWKDQWQNLVEDLRKKVSYIAGGDRNDSSDQISQMGRSPGLYDVLRSVEENLSKPAFDTLLRFIYIAPKETYYDSFARRGLVGSFNQYGSLDLNSFVQNHAVSTRTLFWYWPHIFPKIRNEYKKQRAIKNYINRAIPPERWIGKLLTSGMFSWNFSSKRFKMTTKCLATLFHPPTAVVLTAPHVKRVESRKGGPPAGLAIYGEDEEEVRRLFS